MGALRSFILGQDPDTDGLVGRYLDAAGLFGRHFAIGGPMSVRKPPDNAASVRKPPENGCDVRKLPGSTGGTPRACESRPATPAAPRACPKSPENADGILGKCPKAALQCGAGAGVRFSPAAATTAQAPSVSRCAAVVLLRACRESALIPRGYERAHTGRSLRHRARGR